MLPATRTNLAWQVPVASVVVVWVYRLCAMSYREYAALETRAEEDALQLADKMNHQGLADELTKQHALGKRLIGTEDQQAFEAWKQKTVDIMVEYGTSVQDRHHFEDVTNFDLAGTPPGYTGTKRKHFVYVQRIADISTKHAQIAEQLGLDARRRRD